MTKLRIESTTISKRQSNYIDVETQGHEDQTSNINEEEDRIQIK